MFGRVLLRRVRPDIVRALIRVSVVKNDPVLEMVIMQWLHTVFLSALLSPPLLSSSLPSPQPLHLSVSVSVSCGMTYKDIQLNKVISSTSLRVYGEHALICGFSLSAWNVLFFSVIHHTINFCNVSQCNFKCVNYYKKKKKKIFRWQHLCPSHFF